MSRASAAWLVKQRQAARSTESAFYAIGFGVYGAASEIEWTVFGEQYNGATLCSRLERKVRRKDVGVVVGRRQAVTVRSEALPMRAYAGNHLNAEPAGGRRDINFA